MAYCWGVGKGKVLIVQKAGHALPSIGSVSASQADVVQEATSFMAACYGETKPTNDCCASEDVGRLNWQSEYCFRSKASVTPPTDESAKGKAIPIFQACIWRHAEGSSPLLLDPLEHGWMRVTVNFY